MLPLAVHVSDPQQARSADAKGTYAFVSLGCAKNLVDRDRLRITPKHFAYLKISEGCDRLCTFCAIPKMRGRHVTKPMEEVVAEAQELAANGVRELIVVAQDTTYYGMDLYGQPMLAEL